MNLNFWEKKVSKTFYSNLRFFWNFSFGLLLFEIKQSLECIPGSSMNVFEEYFLMNCYEVPWSESKILEALWNLLNFYDILLAPMEYPELPRNFLSLNQIYIYFKYPGLIQWCKGLTWKTSVLSICYVICLTWANFAQLQISSVHFFGVPWTLLNFVDFLCNSMKFYRIAWPIASPLNLNEIACRLKRVPKLFWSSLK